MESAETYSLFMATDVACRILGVDPPVMLETSGLAEIARGRTELRVTAGQYSDAWNKMEVLSPRADYVPYLGVAISRGPVIPVFFTLSCAPDLKTGLMRLAQFKALLAPTRMRVFRDGPLVRVEFDSADTSSPMPPSLGALQLVCMVETFAEPMVWIPPPRAVTLRIQIIGGKLRGAVVATTAEYRLHVKVHPGENHLIHLHLVTTLVRSPARN